MKQKMLEVFDEFKEINKSADKDINSNGTDNGKTYDLEVDLNRNIEIKKLFFENICPSTNLLTYLKILRLCRVSFIFLCFFKSRS